MKTDPRWLQENPLPKFASVTADLEAEVAVVGGGMTGISTAYLLSQAGMKVVLLERGRLGGGETSHTSAHLTYVTDARLTDLVRKFGADHAQAAWDAGRAAMECIRDNVEREQIACDYARVPGFLHLPYYQAVDGRAVAKLRGEAEEAASLGFEAAYVEAAPVVGRPAIRFANQAEFHPMKYMAGLVKGIERGGGRIFEHAEVTEFEPALRMKVNGHRVSCGQLVIATHVPLLGENSLAGGTLFQSRLAGYSSYVVGAKLPAGTVAPSCFWDTNDPYDYVRVERRADCDYVIYGGEDHKTGQVADVAERYERVEARLRDLFPNAKVVARWSGQVIKTNDDLPLIGQIVPGQFIATGFIGNGLTFGTLAAIMARDAFTGRRNPWSELFDPHRKKVIGGTWDYLKQNLDYPYYLVRDHLRRAEGDSLADLPRGAGRILKIDGHKAACHRDEKGGLHVVSPTCTHMGCLVHWNDAERTWDCPCHGSRFTPDGAVIAGPAETALEPMAAKGAARKKAKPVRKAARRPAKPPVRGRSVKK